MSSDFDTQNYNKKINSLTIEYFTTCLNELLLYLNDNSLFDMSKPCYLMGNGLGGNVAISFVANFGSNSFSKEITKKDKYYVILQN